MKLATQAPFWMVYGLDQGPPTHRHSTYEVALIEARRLARISPGTEFYVLRTVAVAHRIDVEVRTIDAPEEPYDDDRPF